MDSAAQHEWGQWLHNHVGTLIIWNVLTAVGSITCAISIWMWPIWVTAAIGVGIVAALGLWHHRGLPDRVKPLWWYGGSLASVGFNIVLLLVLFVIIDHVSVI